jgi:hypothetical protein
MIEKLKPNKNNVKTNLFGNDMISCEPFLWNPYKYPENKYFSKE